MSLLQGRLLLVLAMVGAGVHSAHAHGIAGIDSFPARSRLMIRPWPTKRLCQISQLSNAQTRISKSCRQPITGFT
jgi:hypothetical protein